MRILTSFIVWLTLAGVVWSQDLQSLPPPFVEETCLPSAYFTLDFALVQPRLKSASFDGGPSFSSNLDWTISPRFELGLLNRGPWIPYIGYQGIFSESNDQLTQRVMDSFYTYYRSTELHALDFGLLSEPFSLLSVIRAQLDFSARLTILDFYDRFGVSYMITDPSYMVARLRQQFVGAGPRAGLRMMLPFQDSGLSLAGQIDGGVEWGAYRARIDIESRIDDQFSEESDQASKGGLLWHAGAQLALRYSPPRYCDRLSFSAGYLYETWFSKDMNLLDGNRYGRFDYHGPFFRMEWKY
jgi:hypothetical protein